MRSCVLEIQSCVRPAERSGDRVVFSVPLVVKGVQSFVLVAFVVALFH